MRLFILLAAALLTSTQMVHAETIPPMLEKSIRNFTVTDIKLDQGVLRIGIDRPVVTQEIYRSVASLGVCMPLWLDAKRGWGRADIRRVEVVNRIQAQGFAFMGGRKECQELGKVSGGPDKEKAYLHQHTWVCVAGNPCRPRRDGEKTSGD